MSQSASRRRRRRRSFLSLPAAYSTFHVPIRIEAHSVGARCAQPSAVAGLGVVHFFGRRPAARLFLINSARPRRGRRPARTLRDARSVVVRTRTNRDRTRSSPNQTLRRSASAASRSENVRSATSSRSNASASENVFALRIVRSTAMSLAGPTGEKGDRFRSLLPGNALPRPLHLGFGKKGVEFERADLLERRIGEKAWSAFPRRHTSGEP